MEKSRAIELLKLAVPIKALTQQEYADFVEAVNMGMDALEHPTSPDTIDRKAAIDAAESAYVRNMFPTPLIREVPTVEPEPQWIPVSERLPETGGESFFDGMVLITLRDKETGDLYVLNDKYCGDGDWLMCVQDEPTEVIAWMPLPEPYKPNK